MLKPLLSLLLCCFLWTISAQSTDCSLGLVLSSTTAEAGEEITIDVTTRQYNAIVGMQYSHQWNPQVLDFIEVTYNQDLSINAANFGLTSELLDQGILNFTYVNPLLQGNTLADGEALYSIRFEVLSTEETTIELVPLSGTIEFIDDAQSPLQNFYLINGRVGAADAYPSMNSACILPQACDDPDLGRIDISPTGTESLSVAWSSPGGFMGEGVAITGLNASVYDMTLADALGNSVTGTFYLGSETELDVDLSVDADLCGEPADGSVSTTVSGGSGNYGYQWSNGATTANIENVPAGTYDVTITDLDSNCSVTASATVQSNSTLIGFFNSNNPSCEANADGSLTINVEGPPEASPLTYSWSNGATTETAENLAEGFYSVTVGDATGCSTVFSTFLSADELLLNADVVNTTCESNNGSITLQLNPGDYTISWSNGASSASIDNLGVGSYDVTVTDNTTNCSTTASYDITGEELAASWTYECFDLDGQLMTDITVLVWNMSGPYQFDWSNGESASAQSFHTITVPAGGTYDVTITSAEGCTVVVSDIEPLCANNEVELYLSPATTSIGNGETQCFEVQASNFNQITGLQFTLAWDATKVSFDELGELSLPDLVGANFNTNLTDDGLVSVSWLASDVLTGVSLPNGSSLFEICLSGATSTETFTILDFSDFPTPLEVTNVDLSTLQVNTQHALIQLNGGGGNGGENLELHLASAAVAPGEQFCVSVTTQSFTDIRGMQGTISWDQDALQLTGFDNFNLQNLTDNSFGELAEAQLEGLLRFFWIDPNAEGVTVADNSTLFDLCFVATGAPGTYTVDFVNDPLPLEAVDGDLEFVSIETQAGQVIIGEQGEGAVVLEIVSGAVAPGETICVPVRAVQFSDIVGMQFSMNWDQSRIHFDDLNFPDNVLEVSTSDFNIDPDAGNLRISWVASQLDPMSLAPGTTLFELCYTAQSITGPAGISFSSTPTAIEFIQGTEVVPFIPMNGTVMITEDNLVWPGDTNNDGVANNLDVFPLGLGYTANGDARINPSTAWVPQFAPLWAGSTPGNDVNFRHADTNGDGTINASDTTALSFNWGQTADQFGEPEDPASFLTGAPIYVQADTLQAGVQVRLPIMLGAGEPVEQAYGLAFTLRYDPETVELGSIHLEANGWLLGEPDEHLLMYHDYPADGRVEVGMVRIDGQGVSGEGQIAELIIIMEDVILRNLIDVETYFKIEDVALINPGEVEIPTSPRETTVLVEGVTNTDELLDNSAIQIAPNPTVGLVQIRAQDLELQQLELLNARGRTLLLDENPDPIIDLTNYPAGIYYLRISTDQGMLYEKVVKQ